MEDKYEENLNFTDTTPLNNKFEFFGTDNKNYTLNSGSLYMVVALIYISAMLRYCINFIALKRPHNKCCRAVGVYFHKGNSSTR